MELSIYAVASILANNPEKYEDLKEVIIQKNKVSRIQQIVELLKKKIVVEQTVEDEDRNSKIKEVLRNIYEDFSEELYSERADNDHPFLFDEDYYEDFDIIYIEDEKVMGEESVDEELHQIKDPDDLFENMLWSDLEDEKSVQKAYEILSIKIEENQRQIQEKRERAEGARGQYIILNGEGYGDLDKLITELDDQIEALEEKNEALSKDISFIESVMKFHKAKKAYETEVMISEQLSKEEEELGINKYDYEIGE